MAQLNEKLSTAAKVAIGALIYSQVKKMQIRKTTVGSDQKND